LSIKPHQVYLVDGSGYIFRAYHALPRLSRSDGLPTGAVLGYSNMLAKLLEETNADHLAVVFDRARSSFRNQIYDQYKAHRPEPPSDLVPQFKLVRQATAAFNVCAIELEGYEADDLIATYARQAAAKGATVTIVSSDKDLMQLVGNGISMLDPIKQRPIREAEVREKFGVGPDKVADVQALCGDSIDNLLAHATEIKQPKRRQALVDFAGQVRLAKRLVLLKDDVPLPVPLTELAVKPLSREKLFPFLRELEFKKLLERIEARLSETPTML
jgi:DNA polymerase I